MSIIFTTAPCFFFTFFCANKVQISSTFWLGCRQIKNNNEFLNVNHKYIVTLQCPLPIENLGILIKQKHREILWRENFSHEFYLVLACNDMKKHALDAVWRRQKQFCSMKIMWSNNEMYTHKSCLRSCLEKSQKYSWNKRKV